MIPKKYIYHFRNVSLENGLVDNQPEKINGILCGLFFVPGKFLEGRNVPYNFSDMIAVNYLSGVTVAQKVYGDAATALAAINNFNKDSVANTTMLSRQMDNRQQLAQHTTCYRRKAGPLLCN